MAAESHPCSREPEAQTARRADFEELVRRHRAAVLGEIRRRAPDFPEDAAQDMDQEVWMRAWQGYAGLRDRAAFGAWVAGIADRVVLEWRARRHRERRERLAGGMPEPPVARVESGTRADDLAEALDGLDEPFRTVAVLRHREGLSCDEVAERIGAPLGTVTKRLSRAHGLLKERLARKWGIEVRP